MRYKIGDKVSIKPKFHFCSVDGFNNINMKDEFFNEYSRLPYCETVMTIGIVNKDFYILKEDKWAYKWTDEMIEGLVEEENNHLTETVVDVVKESNDRYRIVTDPRFDIEVDEGEYYAVRRKKEYPKTYEECCKVMNYCYNPVTTKTIHKEELIRRFQFLLLYRDAYWKIAGEEMELGKPWEPDYDSGVNKYGIICMDGVVQKSNPSTYWERHLNKVLDFPTKEMRDAFKENFDPDIEFCKEFL